MSFKLFAASQRNEAAAWKRSPGAMEPMFASRTSKVVLSLLLLAAAIGVVTRTPFYLYGMSEEFFAWMLASIVIIHLRVRPDWRDVVGIALAAGMFALVDLVFLHYQFYVIASISFVGMGSLFVMGLRAIWLEGEQRRMALLALIPSILIAASNFFVGYSHLLTEKAHPKVLDLYLYSFDSSLRVQFAFRLGQAFASWNWFRKFSMLFYIGLPFAIAIAYAGQVVRIREKAIPIFAALFLAGPFGILFYNLFPALGPLHIFVDRFPWQPLTTGEARRLFLEPVPVPGLRNAIPSLHMAWVLLAFWYSQKLSALERSMAFAFVVFTVFATMGTGEHYFVDLIVAFPFALFLQALCATALPWSDKRRQFSLLCGLFATLSWFVALRFGSKFFWLSPLIPWICCVVTVAATELLRTPLSEVVTSAATSRTLAEPLPAADSQLAG
jgi:PAP2 superfamily